MLGANPIESLTSGFILNLEIFIVTLLLALPLGLIITFCSMSRFRPLKWITKVFIWVIRGTPLMLQLFVVLYAPGLLFGIPMSSRFTAAIIAFVINYAAYFAEIYRSGIQSMPKGQYEAAKLLGYSGRQTFAYIILPQVIKRILPSVTNEVITLVKDTAFAFTLSVMEMFTKAKALAAGQTSILPLFIAGAFYYIFNYAVAFAFEYAEKKLDYYQ